MTIKAYRIVFIRFLAFIDVIALILFKTQNLTAKNDFSEREQKMLHCDTLPNPFPLTETEKPQVDTPDPIPNTHEPKPQHTTPPNEWGWDWGRDDITEAYITETLKDLE